jgi:hypothetical protein
MIFSENRLPLFGIMLSLSGRLLAAEYPAARVNRF